MGLYGQMQHVSCVALLFSIIYLYYCLMSSGSGDESNNFDTYKKYGRVLTWILYVPRICLYFNIVFASVNFLGIICFNTFPEKPRLKQSPMLGPFICIRVVTRGLYPELVKDNIDRNMKLCNKVGLQNFMFEVVTDIPVNLAKSPFVRELVVPHNYTTSKGTLFKARALQYCLEKGIDFLSDDDWIVHLDEETLLTEESVIGTINFITEGKHHFGQGIIVYTKDKIINWVTTLADSVRVGIDHGSIRFCLKGLNKPFFGWKGSFIVANVGAEKQVSFDHGPEASLAEDCYFALIALSKGYSFGFVEGEMWERSTFTVMDFIRQRRRWLMGLVATGRSSKIPFRYKVGVILMGLSGLSSPIMTSGFFLGMICPLPAWGGVHPFICSVLGTYMFLFIFGTIKSFNIRRMGLVKGILLVFATIGCSVISMLLENVAAVWTWVSPGQIQFEIVQKDISRQSMV